jgi:hypothetical protein
MEANGPRAMLERMVDGCGTGGSEFMGGNRTLWFVGNSVSRHHYFAAGALLKGRDPSSVGFVANRSQQIKWCGRGGSYSGHRPGQGLCYGPCSCSLLLPRSAGGFVRLVFIWQQRTHDRWLNDIFVNHAERKKYAPLEGSPARGDIVFANVGLDGIADALKRGLTKKRLSAADGPRNVTRFLERWAEGLPLQSTSVATAMASAHSDAGIRPVFRSTSPICGSGKHGPPGQWGKMPISYVNSWIAESDSHFRSAMAAHAVPFFDLTSWDMHLGKCNFAVPTPAELKQGTAAANATIACICRGYEDELHPSGFTGALQLGQMAKFACDAYGAKRSQSEETTNKRVRRKRMEARGAAYRYI